MRCARPASYPAIRQSRSTNSPTRANSTRAPPSAVDRDGPTDGRHRGPSSRGDGPHHVRRRWDAMTPKEMVGMTRAQLLSRLSESEVSGDGPILDQVTRLDAQEREARMER